MDTKGKNFSPTYSVGNLKDTDPVIPLGPSQQVKRAQEREVFFSCP